MLAHTRRAVLVAALVVPSSLVPARAVTTQACPMVAHRGEHGAATENGMRALRAAVRSGAEYLEVDVRTTRDDRLVLMHDKTVARTTDGTGHVREKTARQVGRLRLDDGGRVPSLRQAMRFAREADVRMLVDVKTMGRAASYRRLTRLVRRFPPSRVTVISRHRDHLDRIGSRVPNARRALVTDRRLRPRRFARYGAAVVHHRAITGGWLSSMRRAGVPVYAWTVNDRPGWELLSGRVTGVITDVPSRYAEFRRGNAACRG